MKVFTFVAYDCSCINILYIITINDLFMRTHNISILIQSRKRRNEKAACSVDRGGSQTEVNMAFYWTLSCIMWCGYSSSNAYWYESVRKTYWPSGSNCQSLLTYWWHLCCVSMKAVNVDSGYIPYFHRKWSLWNIPSWILHDCLNF